MDKSQPTIISIQSSNHCQVIRLVGELDMATAPHLAAALEPIIRSSGSDAIILDLEALSFLDASGIRVLLALIRLSDFERRSLCARSSRGEVDLVLRLTGVADLLRMPPVLFDETDPAGISTPGR